MQDNVNFDQALFARMPIIAIARGIPLDTLLKVSETYAKAGLYTLEVTLNTDGASDIISHLGSAFPNLCIGAGTVCNQDDLDEALQAGAQFIVTPILNQNLVRECVSSGVPVFPGAYSPTEIYNAWSWGASGVKVFPATALGPQFISNFLAPLPQIKLVPTGGISGENIRPYFEAGAYAVGMGSSLLRKDLIRTQDFDALLQHFVSIKRKIEDLFL